MNLCWCASDHCVRVLLVLLRAVSGCAALGGFVQAFCWLALNEVGGVGGLRGCCIVEHRTNGWGIEQNMVQS